MIRKVILENGTYKGKTRLDEVKMMHNSIAKDLVKNIRQFFEIKGRKLELTKDAHLTQQDNAFNTYDSGTLYKNIKTGRDILNKAFLSGKTVRGVNYFDTITRLINADKVTPNEIKEIVELLEFGF